MVDGEVGDVLDASGLAGEASRRLSAAQLVGAGVSGLLGQLAVNTPGGYFGPAETLTSVGALYGVVVLVLVGVGAIGWLRAARWAVAVSPALLALNIGLFLPALPADAVVAGLVVGWNLILLGRFVFPTSSGSSRSHLPPRLQDELDRWLALNGRAMRHLAVVALLATVAVVGYHVGVGSGVRLLTVGGDLLVLGLSTPFLVFLARRRNRVPLGIWVLAVAAMAGATRPIAPLGLMGAALTLCLALLMIKSPLFGELLEHFLGRPALLVAVSFVVLILFGTLLLSFPAAAAPGSSVSPLDALFTATSASCVTGLIVLDTPHAFSDFGQAVILFLIQAGGLNIMVLSTFAAVLLGRGLGLKGERALGEMLDLQAARAAYRLIVFIVGLTLAVETAGAGLLAAAYSRHGDALPRAVWRGIFHSVSAFCNAGFALQSDSLMMFQHDPFALLTVTALIVLGGLGFAVLAFAWLRLGGRRRVGMAVQARIVLLATITLIVVGWVGYGAGEWGRSLAGLSPGMKVVNALFQSVTARTAGFNSVPMEGLQPATVLLMIALMFVGASPGGTGGGIKTTTMVVLLSAVPTMARGRPEVVLLRRRIALETLYRSAVIVVVATLIVLGASLLLLATQGMGFDTLMFETVSAFGTVGLSLGATPALDGFGRVVIILTMLAGRIGPLTVALLLGRQATAKVGYPEASIMVG